MGARTTAREAALQMLYAVEATEHRVERVVSDYWRETPGDAEGRPYADDLVRGVAERRADIDERIRAAYFIVEPRRTQLAEIARLIDGGTLRPVVGAVFPLGEARQAYQHKPVRGKVVLRVVDGNGAT